MERRTDKCIYRERHIDLFLMLVSAYVICSKEYLNLYCIDGQTTSYSVFPVFHWHVPLIIACVGQAIWIACRVLGYVVCLKRQTQMDVHLLRLYHAPASQNLLTNFVSLSADVEAGVWHWSYQTGVVAFTLTLCARLWGLENMPPF